MGRRTTVHRPKIRSRDQRTEDAFAWIGDSMRRWSDLGHVRSVRSCLTSFNRATQCGGAPLGNVLCLTGPMYAGKSTLAYLAGVLSFVSAGHFAAYLNTEQKVDRRWLEALATSVGIPFPVDHPYESPRSFERVCELLFRLISSFVAARAKGKIAKDRALSIVLDSLDQAIPSDWLATLGSGEKLDSDSLRSARGFDRDKAILNKKLLETLVATVGGEDVIVWIVAHEGVRDKTIGRRTWKENFTKGGSEIEYKASTLIRCWYAATNGPITEGSGQSEREVGRWHNFRVIKNGTGYPLESGRIPLTSGLNGYRLVEEGCGNPRGLDVARELLYEAAHRELATIEKGRVRCQSIGIEDEEVRKVLWGLRRDKDLAATLRVTLDK